MIRLAVLAFRDGHLPSGGGVMDQDPVLMDLLWTVRNSRLWGALNLG